MKKIVLSISTIAIFAFNSAAMASMSYECWTHPGGHPDKMVHVSANSKSEAESLAIDKFINIGVKPEAVSCK